MTCSHLARVAVCRWVIAVPWLFVAASQFSCKESPSNTSMPTRDINAVLRDNDKMLMAVPGVVGVYVGLLPDGKTACLKVMAATNTPLIQARVPEKLEGYVVVIEETGTIRPLQDQRTDP